jgi:hypothetical protein
VDSFVAVVTGSDSSLISYLHAGEVRNMPKDGVADEFVFECNAPAERAATLAPARAGCRVRFSLECVCGAARKTKRLISPPN